MSSLPWWLKLLVKILFVDLLIALLVAGWSWIAQDFSPVALSNRFFAGGAIAILISLLPVRGTGLIVPTGSRCWPNRPARQTWPSGTGGWYGQGVCACSVMIPAGVISILIAIMLGQHT